MIKLEKTATFGWDEAVRGMRNPLNSWKRTDSVWSDYDTFDVGPNDLKLMKSLANAGTSHSKYRRMITVYVDITAPLYWWKEFDTYKVGTVANSCSTMHTIAQKEFTLEDFSHEHLMSFYGVGLEEGLNKLPYIHVGDNSIFSPAGILNGAIKLLNRSRELYLETHDKQYWWQMIQLLPSSYNQRRTVMMNYEVVAAIVEQRKGHKLDEWHDFIEWAHKLPLAKEIIFCEDGEQHG